MHHIRQNIAKYSKIRFWMIISILSWITSNINLIQFLVGKGARIIIDTWCWSDRHSGVWSVRKAKKFSRHDRVVHWGAQRVPFRAKKKVQQKQLKVDVTKKQAKAEVVQARVEKDEAVVGKQAAAETKAIADDAQADLDEAMPAFKNALKALDALEKKDHPRD